MKSRINGSGRRRRRLDSPITRTTIVLPDELLAFGHERARMSHCDNFSSYLRWLILEDARKAGVKVAA